MPCPSEGDLVGGSSRIYSLSRPRAGGCSAVGIYNSGTSAISYLFIVGQRA
jgi:hypothetical protein